MTKLVEIKNVKVNIGKPKIVKEIAIDDFTINKGDIVIMLGKNGSGKTSFLKAFFSSDIKNYELTVTKTEQSLSRFLNENTILELATTNDVNVHNYSRNIIFSQQANYFGYFDNVYENLTRKTIEQIERMDNKEELYEKLNIVINKHKDVLLSLFKDQNQNNKNFKKLLKSFRTRKQSGGVQRMISVLSNFIYAEVIDVELIVLDEPLNELDFVNQRYIKDLIDEMANYKTLIIISHFLFFDFMINRDIKMYRFINDKIEKFNPNNLDVPKESFEFLRKLETYI